MENILKNIKKFFETYKIGWSVRQNWPKTAIFAQFWRVFDTVSPHWRIKRLIFDCCGHVTSQTTKLEAFLGKFYPKKLKNLKSAVSSKRCVVETSMSAQNDQNRKIIGSPKVYLKFFFGLNHVLDHT